MKNRKIIRWDIVGSIPAEAALCVNEVIEAGYQPYGEPIVIDHRILQTVVKYEEEKEKETAERDS